MTDSIIIGENWISEHYFASTGRQSFNGQVLERRKEWDEPGSVRSQFTGARQELVRQYARLADALAQEQSGAIICAEIYDHLLEVLGYNRIGLEHTTHGPLTRIRSTDMTSGGPLVILRAKPVDDVQDLLAKNAVTLFEPYEINEKHSTDSAGHTLTHVFNDPDAPEFALVLSGGILLIAQKTRWAEGRYLAVDLALVSQRNDTKRGGEVERALTCVAAESLAPAADGSVWWSEILEESVSHTVGVSKDLRDGVRESIEIIASDVVARRRAQGLPALPQDQAQPLAVQSLRFLYRILFLLYAEASPELGVLPAGDPAYERGYSLDRLRELALVEISDPREEHGTHLYDSLAVLFRMVDEGHENGITFNPLRADLFTKEATKYIDEVGLGNKALQGVLQRLLVSKKTSKADRGFISYAELGINQLGAVYEGLMSYTGFFAEEDLYEVAPGGDASKGSWVVPTHRAEGIAEKDFVTTTDPVTGIEVPVLHRRGSFVYRLAGRERQQSASYYTPEVLTRFTVSQALEELLDQYGKRTSAREILDLTVCEPALGSGAFAIEAVRQLADEYLRRREEELGERVDPEDRPQELQKVKAYLALHNVYGVDLNATAVELAEISLWLDTMGKGLAAPWFGLHLRRGNSLIGARRAVYSSEHLKTKAWLKAVPKPVPLSETLESGIHHFLLPAEGWGSAINAKEGKNLAPERVKELRAWRRSVHRKLSKPQIARFQILARRVERLWGFALQRLTIAEAQIRRSIDVWGADDLPTGGQVTREEIEESLADPKGAFQRLKMVMDAWNALWFWPLTDRLTVREIIDDDGEARTIRIEPPSLDQWLEALEALVGSKLNEETAGSGRRWRGGDETLASTSEWKELGAAEEFDLAFAGAQSPERIRTVHPWLDVTRAIAAEQGFFHWELLFGPVFAQRGGFDLQVGNPPWVRPTWDEHALLSEGNPWFQLATRPTQAAVREKREETLQLPGLRDLMIDGNSDIVGTAGFVGSAIEYPHLVGLQPDLYRCFMEQTWRHQSSRGITGLIHPETHFTDEKARALRRSTYRRLRRHWQFINELTLFEIHHLVSYGVHVYGQAREPEFLHATSLYHPETVERSLHHNGEGAEPGLKDDDGNWDRRPHKNRIITTDQNTLKVWHALLESDEVPISETRMVYTVNQAAAHTLTKIAEAPRAGDLEPEFSSGWHEKSDRAKGRFETKWGQVTTWKNAILQGPHMHVGTPFFKAPNSSMRNNLDWSDVDLEALAADALPVTSYKPTGDRAVYNASYTHWEVDGRSVSARDHYRLAWRRMAANTGERTLISAIIPPGAAHVNAVFTAAYPHSWASEADSSLAVVTTAGLSESLIADFTVRSAPKGDIYHGVFERLPFPEALHRNPALALRVLRLNCLTGAYADLWSQVWKELTPTDPPEPHPFTLESWTGGIDYRGRPSLGDAGPEWTQATPLRRESDRRQALLEIDVLVAMSLGITVEELTTIYRTQFPVLYGYDHGKYLYDANGRVVPTPIQQLWRRKGDSLTEAERTATHPGSGVEYVYELPFIHLDREADFHTAHEAFTTRAGAVVERE